MPNLESYRQQHHELIGLITETLEHLDADTARRKAVHLYSLILRLADKLGAHLSQEDLSLYPELLRHAAEPVRKTAERYMRDMGDLQARFLAFTKRYDSPIALQNNADEFVRDTQILFNALAERMFKEDAELYPLAEQHQD